MSSGELNSSPLEEQQVLETAEPPPQAPEFTFKIVTCVIELCMT